MRNLGRRLSPVAARPRRRPKRRPKRRPRRNCFLFVAVIFLFLLFHVWLILVSCSCSCHISSPFTVASKRNESISVIMKRKAPNQQSTIDEYSSTVAGVVRFKRPFDPYQNPDEKYNHVVRVCVNFSYHALVKHCCKKLTESQEKNVSRSSKMGRLQNGAALRHRRKRRHFAFSSVVESQRFCQSIFKNLERIISSGHSPKIGQE